MRHWELRHVDKRTKSILWPKLVGCNFAHLTAPMVDASAQNLGSVNQDDVIRLPEHICLDLVVNTNQRKKISTIFEMYIHLTHQGRVLGNNHIATLYLVTPKSDFQRIFQDEKPQMVGEGHCVQFSTEGVSKLIKSRVWLRKRSFNSDVSTPATPVAICFANLLISLCRRSCTKHVSRIPLLSVAQQGASHNVPSVPSDLRRMQL